MQIFVATLVLSALITFYIISYRLNKRQALPDGVSGTLKSCGACDNSSCGSHPEQRGTKDE